MRWTKRISHLLMLIILCVLIFYAGIYLQIDVSGGALPLKINQTLIEKAGEMYLSGLFFADECGQEMYNNEYLQNDNSNKLAGEIGCWISEQAMNLLPIGSYVNSMQNVDTQIEDEETYEMVLAMQAGDENEVDEDGNLIENENVQEETGDDNIEKSVSSKNISMEKLEDFEYLVSNFYTVDSSTSVTESLLDAKKLLKKDMKIDQNAKGPKILIYHTHSQEAFKDSKKGKSSDTIMGMGAYLSEILNDKYGIENLHHEGVYDLIDGQLDRSKAYQLAEPDIQKILKDNPSIEVVIDLHRDGVKESTHLVTEINGKKTAQIMFFNGMSRTKANGNIEYLKNPYIEDNLALSLQMQLEAMEKYPGFTRRIYLKSYRYNMHLRPKTMLIEAGAQTNTVAEMRNAMEYLAEILDSVLTE